MRHIVGVLLCVLGVVWGLESTCDDIDEDICRTFNNKVSVCDDTCLSKLCPRTCNKCPRKCYSCNGVSSLNDCNTTRICPDLTYDCLVHEGISSDFKISYQLGCATKDVCVSLFEASTTRGAPILVGKKKRHGIDGECCSTDLCNRHVPVKRKRQIVIMTGTIPDKPTTDGTTISATSSNACADIDMASCQKLATLKRNMCSDDCFVQACPRTCGKCSECYSCHFVESPENCTSTSVCLPGEQCYVLEKLMDNGKHGYQIGCLHENVCRRFHVNAGDLFGRRSDHVGLTLDGNCCNGDLCNHHALVHTTTTTTHAPTHAQPTTPAPYGCKYSQHSHCPNGFFLLGGKCILVRQHLVTYSGAKDSCENHHCAKLMDNISERDADNIRHYVNRLLPDVSPELKEMFVGAHVNSHHHLVWDSSGHAVPGVPHDSPSDTCVVLRTDDHHHFMRTTSCDHHHFYICEAEFK
ncbi:uncharacterized protein LOC134229267 [Saccostrea cucullata]|uniref:uncharacterized protein LOC134229267 n=1 Tax=Saccostrea cuccullata TaxID=36930 RepID=UPI002ED00ECC